MSKAILVMDMPESCLHCKLRKCIHIRDKFYQHCGLDTNGYCLESFFNELDLQEGFRSEKCPLKPIPEKKVVKQYQGNGVYGLKTAEEAHFAIGWNACIDELLKDGGVNE